MKHTVLCLLVLLAHAPAAQPTLTYYLPDMEYDADMPTPESVFGWQIGEWHLSHDLQRMYMQRLADESPRITLTEYGRTYEGRPLVYLTITSEANHARLDELKERHRRISEGQQVSDSDINAAPLVVYQGFSIHGNEPSGANAAPLVAYYLAAANTPEVQRLLDQTIILLDPSFNPDGMQRFSSWVNMHRNINTLTANPADREYNEAWPRGRTNHYWFDLNRDWLPAIHPESQGRIRLFQEWRPNILTDHHEMGTNATFFFMPGEPTRVHPITPKLNQELTGRIGAYHAAALDKIGSLYYSKEGYDDFYYGKGSTYPDVQGAIGILFEQASSRGHVQESENGLLTFPFTIRNQVTTALSTHAAAVEMKNDLLRYQSDFYREAAEENRNGGGFVFADAGDAGRTRELLKMMQRHGIEIYSLKRDMRIGTNDYRQGQAYVVPMNQRQGRLVKSMFQTLHEFEDSLFYDISTWTLPYAFNLPYSEVSAGQVGDLRGTAVAEVAEPQVTDVPLSRYGYLLPWDDYYAAKTAYQLLDKGLRLKVSQGNFTTAEGREYKRGTVMIQVENQNKTPEEIHRLVQEASRGTGVQIEAVSGGMTTLGSNLGSRSFGLLRKPQVLLLIDGGVNSNDAGEAWHVLDQRFAIPVTKLETGAFNRTDISRFNTIILVDGTYNELGQAGANKLRAWLNAGNVLIAQERGAKWAADNGLAGLRERRVPRDTANNDRRSYETLDRDEGGRELGGAIFEARADLTHPLLYGLTNERMPLFRGSQLLFEPAQNDYATPLVYSDAPLLSGYVHRDFLAKVPGSAAALVTGVGQGRVIALMDNPNFRGFWYGTNRLFINSIFFGHTIASGATERPR